MTTFVLYASHIALKNTYQLQYKLTKMKDNNFILSCLDCLLKPINSKSFENVDMLICFHFLTCHGYNGLACRATTTNIKKGDKWSGKTLNIQLSFIFLQTQQEDWIIISNTYTRTQLTLIVYFSVRICGKRS